MNSKWHQQLEEGPIPKLSPQCTGCYQHRLSVSLWNRSGRYTSAGSSLFLLALVLFCLKWYLGVPFLSYLLKQSFFLSWKNTHSIQGRVLLISQNKRPPVPSIWASEPSAPGLHRVKGDMSLKMKQNFLLLICHSSSHGCWNNVSQKPLSLSSTSPLGHCGMILIGSRCAMW